MPSRIQHRLRKHPDYQRVYKGSRKQWARQVAYFALGRAEGSEAAQRSETTGPRIGLTVPKALGNAVTRNRIKRRLRAVVRGAVPTLQSLPVDVVLHPKRTVLEMEFGALEREVAQIFRQVRQRHAEPAPAAGPTKHDAAR